MLLSCEGEHHSLRFPTRTQRWRVTGKSKGQMWAAHHPPRPHACGLSNVRLENKLVLSCLPCSPRAGRQEPRASPEMLRAREMLRPALNGQRQLWVQAVAVRCFDHDRHPAMPRSTRPRHSLVEAASTAGRGARARGEGGPPSMAEGHSGSAGCAWQRRRGPPAEDALEGGRGSVVSHCGSGPREAEPRPTGAPAHPP